MPRKSKPRLPEGDDGRTIASMNVEGMPWFSPEQPGQRKPGPDREQGTESLSRSGPGHAERGSASGGMTRREARLYAFGAMKAALLVTGVMCLALVLFILFCQFVWFRP
ncbi:MAG: hypothetical protein IKP22_15625 [Clostridia bacterium]|nr:hypothetical protein [Clostridia bacterium]